MPRINNNSMEQPDEFWLKRATNLKQNGDLVHAVVLERHVVRSHPENDAACMAYVQTLQQLHCYEESTREAFAALAVKPTRTALYGLIGQNQIALGQTEEGLDALRLYADAPVDETQLLPAWHDDAIDLLCTHEELPDLKRKRGARLKGLIAIAVKRMDAGDMESAKRALHRASLPPYQAPSASRELAMAEYYKHLEQNEEAAACCHRAIMLHPQNARTVLSAAVYLRQLGRKAEAQSALVRAAFYANNTDDELAVCNLALLMGGNAYAYAMLYRSLRRHPNRIPLLYNASLCGVELDHIEEAQRYANLLREIDPDDPAGEVLQMFFDGEGDGELDRLCYYGTPSSAEMSEYFHPVTELLAKDPHRLAKAVDSDPRIRRRFLMLLQFIGEDGVEVLRRVVNHLSLKPREVLLRQVLTLSGKLSLTKQYAYATLQKMGILQPYLYREHGRILLMDLNNPPAEEPTIWQKLTVQRVRRCLRYCPEDANVLGWAFSVIMHMKRSQRLQVFGDNARIWSLALAMRYRKLCGLPPLHLPREVISRTRLCELTRALRILSTFSGGQSHADH